MTLNKEDMELVRKYMKMSDAERNLERIAIQNEMSDDEAHKLMLLNVANESVLRAHQFVFDLKLQGAFD